MLSKENLNTTTNTAGTASANEPSVLTVPEGVNTLVIDGVQVAVGFLREMIGQEGYKRHWTWKDETGEREGVQERKGNVVVFTMTREALAEDRNAENETETTKKKAK